MSVFECPTDPDRGHVPAYGPVDALLTYAMFYVVIGRVTPTMQSALSAAVPDLSPATVGLGLAAFLWFVLVVTIIDQARRQLAAVGIGRHSAVAREPSKSGVPAKATFVVYLMCAVFAGVIVVGTFEPAIDALVAVIVIVARPETATFDLTGILLLVLFFVAYGVLTWSVDRLVVGGVRSVLW